MSHNIPSQHERVVELAEARIGLSRMVDEWETDPRVIYWPEEWNEYGGPQCIAVTRKRARCKNGAGPARGIYPRWLYGRLVVVTRDELELLVDGLCYVHREHVPAAVVGVVP